MTMKSGNFFLDLLRQHLPEDVDKESQGPEASIGDMVIAFLIVAAIVGLVTMAAHLS